MKFQKRVHVCTKGIKFFHRDRGLATMVFKLINFECLQALNGKTEGGTKERLLDAAEAD